MTHWVFYELGILCGPLYCALYTFCQFFFQNLEKFWLRLKPTGLIQEVYFFYILDKIKRKKLTNGWSRISDCKCITSMHRMEQIGECLQVKCNKSFSWCSFQTRGSLHVLATCSGFSSWDSRELLVLPLQHLPPDLWQQGQAKLLHKTGLWLLCKLVSCLLLSVHAVVTEGYICFKGEESEKKVTEKKPVHLQAVRKALEMQFILEGVNIFCILHLILS